MSINKDNISIDWASIQGYHYDLINSGSIWYSLLSGSPGGMSAPYIVEWNAGAVASAMGMAMVGYGNIANAVSKLVGVYNYTATQNATGSTANVSWLRNLPVYIYGGQTLFLSGGHPNTPQDLFYLTYAKRLLNANLPDLPTATEVWNGWPISSANYFGTGFGTHSNLYRDGTDAGGYAINKELSFIYYLLMSAEINGETTFLSTAKNFLNAWYTKFPNMGDEQPIDNPNYGYNTYRVLMQCLIVNELYKLQQISDSELTNTYLPKLYNRVYWLETGSWSGPDDYSRRVLAAEVLYNNLSGSATIPDPFSGVTVANHVGYINTGSSSTALWIDALDEPFCRSFGQWGLIIKHPIPLRTQDTLSIISKTLTGSLVLTPTNLTLTQTGSGIKPNDTWSPIVVTTTDNYWYIGVVTGS